MEKQASNLRNCLLLPLILCIVLFGFNLANAQENAYNKGKFYELGEIKVTGVKSFSPQTVVAYTGLKKGQRIQIPGEEISATINKLWKLELFSDIEFFITNIDETIINEHLYTQHLPDVDLLIRTSGEVRISNFLLWQIAYAELYFTDVMWPEFDEYELHQAINSYLKRERRFGKTSEQLT